MGVACSGVSGREGCGDRTQGLEWLGGGSVGGGGVGLEWVRMWVVWGCTVAVEQIRMVFGDV